jgi:hypothetical protein
MPKFEWDEHKNRKNQKKHGISFEDATSIFEDKYRIQKIAKRNEERRYMTIGKIFKVIILVVYTVRTGALRIISARYTRRDERNDYLNNKLKSKGDEK